MPTVISSTHYVPARGKRLTLPKTPRRLTLAEMEAMVEENEYPSFELVDGELTEKREMGGKASKLCSKLCRRVGTFVEQHDLGHVFNSEASYKCFPGARVSIRKPDISFVKRGRFPKENVPEGNILIAPDLAIEVVSLHDSINKLERKLEDYRRAGIPEVWVVIYASKKIRVFKANSPLLEFNSNEVLTSELLPGFSLKVGDLFDI